MPESIQRSKPDVAMVRRVTRASQLDQGALQKILRLAEAGVSEGAVAALLHTTPGVVRVALYQMRRSPYHLRLIKKKANEDVAGRLINMPGMTFSRLADLMGVSMNKARALVYRAPSITRQNVESLAERWGMNLERIQAGGWQLRDGEQVKRVFETLQEVDDYLSWQHFN